MATFFSSHVRFIPVLLANSYSSFSTQSKCPFSGKPFQHPVSSYNLLTTDLQPSR